MTRTHAHLIFGPELSLGPGLGVHPSRHNLVPSGHYRPMPAHAGVAEALLHRAADAPEAEAFFFLDADERLATLTNAATLAWARQSAAALARRGVGRGDRVLLCFDTSPELIAAFFGCSLLGAAPIMAEPPLGAARRRSFHDRVQRMIADARPAALVADERSCALLQPIAEARALPLLGPASLLEPGAIEEVAPSRPDDLAFIQFSSGTTSDAKGVLVTNAALVANVRCMGAQTRYGADDMTVGWLPLHHDMGLLATVLWPFFHGTPAALMAPLSFLFKPQRWLWAFHYFRASVSPAPNFAYQLCVHKIPEAELAGLDLGAWRLALNGAELVLATTLDQFQRRFGGYGFRLGVHFPVYGMAETVVAATFPEPGSAPRVDRVSREPLTSHGEAVPTIADDASALTFVSVGHPFPEHEIAIVDAAGRRLPERRQGQVLLRGPSLAAGYVNQPDATGRAFREGWLWTGDLGYVADGDLFISGRIKDLVIKGGRNYHPQAFEAAAEEVPGVRRGGVAAFGAPDPEAGTEQVVVVFETELDVAEGAALCRQVERAAFEATGVRPDRVLAAPPRTIPKTTSGKLQRGVLRDLVLSGGLAAAQG